MSEDTSARGRSTRQSKLEKFFKAGQNDDTPQHDDKTPKGKLVMNGEQEKEDGGKAEQTKREPRAKMSVSSPTKNSHPHPEIVNVTVTPDAVKITRRTSARKTIGEAHIENSKKMSDSLVGDADEAEPDSTSNAEDLQGNSKTESNNKSNHCNSTVQEKISRTKSEPKARKSCQPVIKEETMTVNLAPIANIKVKLPPDLDQKKAVKDPEFVKRVNEAAQAERERRIVKVKRKRKYKPGTYELGAKKKYKKKTWKIHENWLENKGKKCKITPEKPIQTISPTLSPGPQNKSPASTHKAILNLLTAGPQYMGTQVKAVSSGSPMSTPTTTPLKTRQGAKSLLEQNEQLPPGTKVRYQLMKTGKTVAELLVERRNCDTEEGNQAVESEDKTPPPLKELTVKTLEEFKGISIDEVLASLKKDSAETQDDDAASTSSRRSMRLKRKIGDQDDDASMDSESSTVSEKTKKIKLEPTEPEEDGTEANRAELGETKLEPLKAPNKKTYKPIAPKIPCTISLKLGPQPHLSITPQDQTKQVPAGPTQIPVTLCVQQSQANAAPPPEDTKPPLQKILPKPSEVNTNLRDILQPPPNPMPPMLVPIGDVRPQLLVKNKCMPNGLLYPVTPPKTPENSSNTSNASTSPVPAQASKPPSHPPAIAPKSPPQQPQSESDFIPLCCCKINGTSFANLNQAMYCQALDSVDGKTVGCCNPVSRSLMVRPAVKIPFMAVCEVHRRRLKLHQCCPGCGHFCTEGKFYHCKKESKNVVHVFHKECQAFRSNKFYCPHCGEESNQVEVTLRLNLPPSQTMTSTKPKVSTVARMKITPPCLDPIDLEKPVICQTPGTVFTTDGMNPSTFRTRIEGMLAMMDAVERPKKYRALVRNIFVPAHQGELEKVFYLLADGIDPDTTYNTKTALHGAAGNGHRGVVFLLLQAGASSNVYDSELRTPLMEAAQNGHLAIMDDLIKAGAVVSAKGEDGMTCLHLAAKAGHIECVKYILDTEKIDVNVTDDGGWTPMIWASEFRHTDIVGLIISKGGDPNIKDNEQNIGLHWAAYSGCVEIAELFLDAGCDYENSNEHGDRPLHVAARQDHYEVVVLLLARGADSTSRNNENETPIMCCNDQQSPVFMALKINQQLRTFAEKRIEQKERFIHRDVSFGREAYAINVVNGADKEGIPTDFQYVIENVETSPMNINRVITSLQGCSCKDNCASVFCVCGRNSVRCWYDKEGKLVPEFNLHEPPLLFECNKACRCWATCNNRVIQNGIMVRLQLFRTAGRGWGVRTLCDIPKGTFVCEYIGELISDSEADRREDDSYLFDLDNKDGETYCIDARRYGNISRFINHLCEPNVTPVKVFVEHQDLRFPRICFFSNRDITANEELGFDYGEKFWIIKWKQFTCTCGSPKCKYSQETIHKTIEDYNRRQEEEAYDDETE